MAPRDWSRGMPLDQRAWETTPSRGGAPQNQPQQGPPEKAVQLFPWWERPLAGSQDIDVRLNTAALGAGPGITITPAGLFTQLQPGYVAVVRFVTLFVDAPTTTLDVDWILLINGGPVQGWDKMGSFPRSATNLSITKEGFVRVPAGGSIGIAIRNNEATARTVGAEYGGWQTPQTAIDLAFGVGGINV
jgi:hypothetical protein